MSATIEQRYLEALRRLRVRTDTLEEMVRWKDDLASRLWRAEVVLRVTGERLYNVEEIEAEVKYYSAVAQKLRETPVAAGNGQ